MPTKTSKRKKIEPAPAVRQAIIPDDLSYMTDTAFGREMSKLAAEIAAE